MHNYLRFCFYGSRLDWFLRISLSGLRNRLSRRSNLKCTPIAWIDIQPKVMSVELGIPIRSTSRPGECLWFASRRPLWGSRLFSWPNEIVHLTTNSFPTINLDLTSDSYLVVIFFFAKQWNNQQTPKSEQFPFHSKSCRSSMVLSTLVTWVYKILAI